MRVLGIVGSPRKKGNTDVLVDRILDGAKSKGAETEKIYLDGLSIKECNGCHVCWKGMDCPKDDDMNGLYPRIIGSDAIVFGTPVYWYGPTALMKAFIDRFVYFNCPENRAKIAGKPAVIAVPYEEEGPDMASPIVTFFEKSLGYLEMRLTGQIIAPGVTKRGEVADKHDVMQQAFDLGTTLA